MCSIPPGSQSSNRYQWWFSCQCQWCHYQWWFSCQVVHKVEESHDDPEHCGSSTLKLVHMFYINYMNTTVGHLNRVVFEELVMFIDPGKFSKTIGTKSSFLVIILGIHESGQTPEEHLEPNLWLFDDKINILSRPIQFSLERDKSLKISTIGQNNSTSNWTET